MTKGLKIQTELFFNVCTDGKGQGWVEPRAEAYYGQTNTLLPIKLHISTQAPLDTYMHTSTCNGKQIR